MLPISCPWPKWKMLTPSELLNVRESCHPPNTCTLHKTFPQSSPPSAYPPILLSTGVYLRGGGLLTNSWYCLMRKCCQQVGPKLTSKTESLKFCTLQWLQQLFHLLSLLMDSVSLRLRGGCINVTQFSPTAVLPLCWFLSEIVMWYQLHYLFVTDSRRHQPNLIIMIIIIVEESPEALMSSLFCPQLALGMFPYPQVSPFPVWCMWWGFLIIKMSVHPKLRLSVYLTLMYMFTVWLHFSPRHYTKVFYSNVIADHRSDFPIPSSLN